MRGDGKPEAYLAEELRAALASDARTHELGISVSVVSARRRVFLSGVVATAERRERVERIARELLPDFEVLNDVSVQGMAQPAWEAMP
jgi:osmotically-inducible protein OsmY